VASAVKWLLVFYAGVALLLKKRTKIQLKGFQNYFLFYYEKNYFLAIGGALSGVF
jgi:hypothetical protein